LEKVGTIASVSMSPPIKSNKRKWKPNTTNESRRLALGRQADTDWNLDSSVGNLPRTRHQRKKEDEQKDNSVARDPLPVAADLAVVDNGVDDDDDHFSVTDDASKSSKSPKQDNKLKYSRAIVEIEPVSEMLSRHLFCTKCHHPLSISFPTVGIATSYKLV